LNAGNTAPPELSVIVDNDVQNQHVYPEYCRVAELMVAAGHRTEVVSPEDLILEGDHLTFDGQKVDLIYLRFCSEPDKSRLVEEQYQHMRKAALANTVILTPHPTELTFTSDKRSME